MNRIRALEMFSFFIGMSFVLLCMVGCADDPKMLLFFHSDTMKNSEQTGIIFPLGDKAPNDYFTGDVHVNMLVTDAEGDYNTQAYNVEFAPGARTYWHSHPGGQLLFVTEGVGYYQEDGKPARRLIKGDVVEIPIGVKHWHGAAPESHFTHLGVTAQVDLGPAEWLGEVTEEEYASLER